MTNKVIVKKIGENVRKFREELGLTQDDLAERCDLKKLSINQMEKGNQVLPLLRLYRIAKILRIEILDILPTIQFYENQK
jgi:transcriptional regulator with XRE-family HTH domain